GGLGLRKLEVMNRACLMKLGSKLQANSDDYWCNVLRGEYGRGYNVDNGTIRVANSSL
ncbi:hypothetical protein A2U01_0094280, partial [Trifolium medium]|nr:hypothetical protein [Trifolium medium]